MTLTTVIGITIIALLLVCIGAVIAFYRMMSPATRIISKDSNMFSVREDSVYSVVVQKIICKLKYELQATKICIGRFHNGGNYVNGLPMKKYTITHETAGGTKIPMMDKCVGVLNSRYSEAFAQLAAIGDYCIADVTDCPDQNFKRDMEMWEFKACYLFLMCQFDGKEEGFISVSFRDTRVMMKEGRDKVTEQIHKIVGLFNMEKELLKTEV